MLIFVITFDRKSAYCELFLFSCSSDEIEKMPLITTPEVAGLPSTVEIGYYTQAVEEMWTHLRVLQPETGMPLSFFTSI